MKHLKSFIMLLIISLQLYSQAPNAFSYQAVARNSDGTILENEQVILRIEILKDAVDGNVVYSESFTPTTTSLGLITLAIGTGELISGDFSSINWGDGTYFIKPILNDSPMGTTQIMSVPYALFAAVADRVNTESQVLTLEGTVLSIKDGNSVDLRIEPVPQVLSLDGNVLSISGGNSIELPIEKSKQTILISGTISNEEAAAQLEKEIGANTAVIQVVGTSGLTSLEISGKLKLYELKVINNHNLETLLINDLKEVGDLHIEQNDYLDSLSINGLETCNSLKIANTGITSFELSTLTSANSYFSFIDNDKATSLSLVNLHQSGVFNINNNDVLDTVNVTSLQIVDDVAIALNDTLTHINLDAVLTGFSVHVSMHAFPSSMVDYFLSRLVSLPDAKEKYVYIQSWPPVPPGPQGIADKATLESRGYTVNIDE